MEEQSQKDEMRAAVRGDRERMLQRMRGEGREPVFVTDEPAAEEPPPPPEPVAEVAAPEPEPAPAAVAEPEPEPEPEVEAEPEPEPPARSGLMGRLRRLFGGAASPPE